MLSSMSVRSVVLSLKYKTASLITPLRKKEVPPELLAKVFVPFCALADDVPVKLTLL